MTRRNSVRLGISVTTGLLLLHQIRAGADQTIAVLDGSTSDWSSGSFSYIDSNDVGLSDEFDVRSVWITDNNTSGSNGCLFVQVDFYAYFCFSQNCSIEVELDVDRDGLIAGAEDRRITVDVWFGAVALRDGNGVDLPFSWGADASCGTGDVELGLVDTFLELAVSYDALGLATGSDDVGVRARVVSQSQATDVAGGCDPKPFFVYSTDYVGPGPVACAPPATSLIGQPDYSTGFVDFAVDAFFGAAAPSAKRMFVPSEMAYDPAGERLFVTDTHNHRILVFNFPGAISGDPSASFVLGQPDFTTGGANPTAPYGNVNTPNAAFGCQPGVNACGLRRVTSVAYDAMGARLFASDPDNNRVLVWNLSAGITSGMPASWVLGQPNLTSAVADAPCPGVASAPTSACGLDNPGAIDYDPIRRWLYVADGENNRVVVYDLWTGIAKGKAASWVLGQPNPSSHTLRAGCSGAPAAAGPCGLALPTSVAHDPATHRLFVSDALSHRVVVFELAGGIATGMAASAVLGQPDFSTATINTRCGGGGASETRPNACGLGSFDTNVTFDANRDRLYVSDSANHRVLAFDVEQITNGERAVHVMGQHSDFASGYDPIDPAMGGITSRRTFVSPFGVTFDPGSDRLFVADGGNHRVMVFDLTQNSSPVWSGTAPAGRLRNDPAAPGRPDREIAPFAREPVEISGCSASGRSGSLALALFATLAALCPALRRRRRH